MCAIIISNETCQNLPSQCVGLFHLYKIFIFMRFFRAGYVNPLQHMRGPNENIIEMARAKVRESIQTLEALLEWKSVVRIPTDGCFGLIDIESGLVPCDWTRTQVYPLVECLARVRILLNFLKTK
jgi:hypothetical protein